MDYCDISGEAIYPDDEVVVNKFSDQRALAHHAERIDPHEEMEFWPMECEQ